MVRVSLFERIKTIFDLVFSEPFFITLFVMLLLIIIILLLNVKYKSKAPKYVIIIICTGVLVLMFARYGKYILSLNDSIVDKFFRAMYFPNVVVYVSMLVVSLLLFTYVFIDNRISKYVKITSASFFFIVWFLFVIVMDTIKENKLSFYEVTELYANTTVMVLVQATMFFFVVWCFIVILDIVIRNLVIKMDKGGRLDSFLTKDDENDKNSL